MPAAVGTVVDVTELEKPPPSASGTLATKPIPHLLVYAMERRLTGSFEFVDPSDDEVSATVVVLGGLPGKVRTRTPVAYLGQVLYEHGVIDEGQLNSSLMDVASRKALQGRALMDSGAISLDTLRGALADQTARKIRHLFTLPAETHFAFYADTDLLAGYGGGDTTVIDPLPTLWRGVRDFPSWPHVRAMLARVERVQCLLAPAASLGRFKLDSDELALAECLRARAMGVHEFSGLGVLVPHIAELLFYCLLITRHIDVAPEPRTSHPPPRPANQVALSSAPPPGGHTSSIPPMNTYQSGSFERPISFNVKVAAPVPFPLESTLPPSPGGVPSSLPPRSMSVPPMSGAPMSAPPASTTEGSISPTSTSRTSVAPTSTPPLSAPPPKYTPKGSLQVSPQFHARKQLIIDRAAAIQKEDFFKMLGVGRDATGEEAQKAFFRLAEVWHPDRLPLVLDEMRDLCGTVFAHLSEAHNVLSDERRRQKYVERLEDERAPTIEIASVRPVPGTSNLFEGAEVCASRKEWDRAESLCQRYIDDHPNHGPSMALLAWAQANKAEHQTAEMTKEQIKILDRALTLDWEYERGYFWRAQLYRRVKQEIRAIKDFRAAASLNPHNIEAAREVRIFDMRRRNTPSYPASGPRSSTTPPPNTTRGTGQTDDPKHRKKTISGLFDKLLKR